MPPECAPTRVAILDISGDRDCLLAITDMAELGALPAVDDCIRIQGHDGQYIVRARLAHLGRRAPGIAWRPIWTLAVSGIDPARSHHRDASGIADAPAWCPNCEGRTTYEGICFGATSIPMGARIEVPDGRQVSPVGARVDVPGGRITYYCPNAKGRYSGLRQRIEAGEEPG